MKFVAALDGREVRLLQVMVLWLVVVFFRF